MNSGTASSIANPPAPQAQVRKATLRLVSASSTPASGAALDKDWIEACHARVQRRMTAGRDGQRAGLSNQPTLWRRLLAALHLGGETALPTVPRQQLRLSRPARAQRS